MQCMNEAFASSKRCKRRLHEMERNKTAFIIAPMVVLGLAACCMAENAVIAQIGFDTPRGQSGEGPGKHPAG